MLANDLRRECVAGNLTVNVGPTSGASAWTKVRVRMTLRARTPIAGVRASGVYQI